MTRGVFTPTVSAVVWALAVSAIPGTTNAQSWRTFDVARQLRDSTPLSVHVSYGAGRVSVRPDQQRNLYGIHMRYDTERTEPVYRYNSDTRTLEVGVRSDSKGRKLGGKSEGSELRVDLSRATPLSLQLDVGAAEGDFDLSGLQLDQLSVQTGATDTHVHFDAPNPRRMTSMRIDMGAASVEMTGLANANAERVDVNLGVGHLLMDFAGDWRGDVAMTVHSALGDVVINLPKDVGVRIETATFLHSLSASGLVKRDGAWVSENWDTARYKLHLRSAGALGKLEIKRAAS